MPSTPAFDDTARGQALERGRRRPPGASGAFQGRWALRLSRFPPEGEKSEEAAGGLPSDTCRAKPSRAARSHPPVRRRSCLRSERPQSIPQPAREAALSGLSPGSESLLQQQAAAEEREGAPELAFQAPARPAEPLQLLQVNTRSGNLGRPSASRRLSRGGFQGLLEAAGQRQRRA